MFEVSEEAAEKIKQFLEGREGPQSIRVLMTERGWKNPVLVMALDEKKEDDEVFTEKGVTFLIGKSLFEKVKPVRIGYTNSTLGSGYTLTSELTKYLKNVDTECHDIYHSCKGLTD